MLKRMAKGLAAFGKRNPARVYTFASAMAIYITKKVPGLPIESVIILIAALFGLGESVQRVENKKTTEALMTDLPKGENDGQAS
ncbi:MAG: hypothetical protein EB127_01070 [Alphaproteobacteria bacterium]|nr:hypothetical protein [Alphaproteobacteria bacterium]